MTTTRLYRIEYQLGSTGTQHRTIPDALRALDRARRAARRGGDVQAITIRAYDVVPVSYGSDLVPVRDETLLDALGLPTG